MAYFADYGLFFAKIVTLIIAIPLFLAGILSLIAKSKTQAKEEQLTVKKLNKKYDVMRDHLQQEILSKKAYKALIKTQTKTSKAEKNTPTHKRRLYTLHFNGDIKASAVESLREEITALLSVATPQDEIVICLESAGGMVHGYGLAASQLLRIREKNIPLTVIVDKVAASGGYLMACVAHKILAAPFAIIGSIGVIAQLPNFHRWLKENKIDFEQISAGEHKRTLTVFGENTEKSREKLKQEIEEIHQQFKTFIANYRPLLNIDQVATGEHWLAEKALALKLIDGLTTTDEYLFSASETADIFSITYEQKKSLSSKLSQCLKQSSMTRMLAWLLRLPTEKTF